MLLSGGPDVLLAICDPESIPSRTAFKSTTALTRAAADIVARPLAVGPAQRPPVVDTARSQRKSVSLGSRGASIGARRHARVRKKAKDPGLSDQRKRHLRLVARQKRVVVTPQCEALLLREAIAAAERLCDQPWITKDSNDLRVG